MHINEISRLIVRFSTLATGFLSVFFWLLIIYGFDEPCAAGLTVICALIHEAGHVSAIWAVRGWRGIDGFIFGPKLKRKIFLSYNEDFFVLASGVCANAAAAGVTLLFPDGGGEYGRMFAVLNIVTALGNLMPVKGRDGYGMAECISGKLELTCGLKVLRIASVVITFCTCTLALYLMDRCGEGFWAYGIFYFSLLQELGEARRN